MKKLVIGLGLFIILLIGVFLAGTRPVDLTPYFETSYFETSLKQVDSLKNAHTISEGYLEAGFAKINLTPSINNSDENWEKGIFSIVPLAGFGDRKGKPATAIHDSLFVKAAAIKSLGQTRIIVSADLLIIPPKIVDMLTRKLVCRGIKRDQLFFVATHTHSSIGGWGNGYVGEIFAGKENVYLQNWIVKQFYEAIVFAVNDLKPAKIGYGSFEAPTLTRNRLVGKLGTKNNTFGILRIEQIGGREMVIGSFAAHATTLGAKNMEISADYPGYWAKKVETTGVDIAMFCAGSMGSQSPKVDGKMYEKLLKIGAVLADSTLQVLPNIFSEKNLKITSISLKLLLPDYHIRISSNRGLSSALSNKINPTSGDAYIQALRIGNVVWITTPADFSGEFAVQIQDRLKSQNFKTIVTSFNGNYLGYIIPGKYFYLDEYESKMMGWYGPYMGDYTMDLIRSIVSIVVN